MENRNKGTAKRIEVPCAGGLTLVAEKGCDPGYNEIFITLEKSGEWFCDLALAGQDYTYGQDNRVENDPSCFRVCVWGDTTDGPADDFTDEIRVHVDPPSGDVTEAAPAPEEEVRPTLEQVRDVYQEYSRWCWLQPSHAGAIMLDTDTGEIWADCFPSGGSTKAYAEPSIIRIPVDELLWDVADGATDTDEAMPETIHAWIHALLSAGIRQEPERLLTDPEYRLLLAAISREKELCRMVDHESPGEVNLERLMDSISRKIADAQYGRKGVR